jgi:hypothetical protein
MPAEAGIQSFGDGNDFQDLDSGLNEKDGVFPLATQSLRKKGEGKGISSGEGKRRFPRRPLMSGMHLMKQGGLQYGT